MGWLTGTGSACQFFVHYDDVQFSKGSFISRVHIKTPQGMGGMTVQLVSVHLGRRINELQVAPYAQWRGSHRDSLKSSFSAAPYAEDALQLAATVYGSEYSNLGVLACASLHALINYFGLDKNDRFVDIGSLDSTGLGSGRVLSLVQKLR